MKNKIKIFFKFCIWKVVRIWHILNAFGLYALYLITKKDYLLIEMLPWEEFKKDNSYIPFKRIPNDE